MANRIGSDLVQSERSLARLAELLALQRRRHGTELRHGESPIKNVNRIHRKSLTHRRGSTRIWAFFASARVPDPNKEVETGLSTLESVRSSLAGWCGNGHDFAG
jgi:hypothetical protein